MSTNLLALWETFSTLFINLTVILISLNLFSLGCYLILRGGKKWHSLRGYTKARGSINKSNSNGVSLEWMYKGISYLGISPNTYVGYRKSVPILLYRDGTDFHLNIWSYNGKLKMFAGILLCITALIFGTILL